MNPNKFTLTQENMHNIIAAMLRMSSDHEVQFGKKPTGYVLGPEEWFAFKLVSSKYAKSYPKLARDVNPLLSGISVYVKTTPGIDLLVHPDDAGQFVKVEYK